jgi:DNA mismatch repair ATPase MutL
MQFVRASITAGLFLLLGTTVPAYAQHEEKESKPEKQPSARPAAAPQRPQEQPHAREAQQPKQQKAQQAPHAQPAQQRAQTPHAQPTQQARQQQQPQRTRQQATAWQTQRGWVQQGGGWQGHTTWQQDRSQNWGSDHRTWAQRGGYGGYYIPQDRFNLYFGDSHWFRMHSLPAFYMGYPRFSYGGFSFLLVDPFPEAWAEDWYDTDELYIGYDNGYYLYDRRYPSIGLAVTVVL